MKYELFKCTVMKEIQQFFGNDAKIVVKKITKNNGIILDGIVLKSMQTNISPTLYLNHFYESYAAGDKSLEDIIRDIIHTLSESIPNDFFDAESFTDFEQAKHHIVYKLINTRENAELLKDIPNVPFLDLSIVFYFILKNSFTENATILIHNDHLSMWNQDVDTIMSIAKKNTVTILPYTLNNMYDIIKETAPCLLDELEMQETSSSMYVLTNKDKLFGFASILYPGVLKNFADKHNCNLYIIPSSIHEALIVPITNKMDTSILNDMITEVNATQVPPEEILSSHGYIYDRATDKITY